MPEKLTQQLNIRMSDTDIEAWNDFKKLHAQMMSDSQLGRIALKFFIKHVNNRNIWWVLEEMLEDPGE